MTRKIAIKRLTASDLTLFRWHFLNKPAGNQKAINLNSDVLIHEFYPSIPEAGIRNVPVDLYLYGPGLHPEHNLQRKVILQQKNWRLDGEFIHNPDDAPTRFDVLEPGDFAVLEFSGAVVAPTTVRAVLLADADSNDAALCRACDAFLGENSMEPISLTHLQALIEEAAPPTQHPINQLLLEEALEDAALGGSSGRDYLRRRGSRRSVSPEALTEARRNAELVGRAGEEFVEALLNRQTTEGELSAYEWTSDTDATAPFDFRVTREDETRVLDVKSTAYEFERPLHISLSELLQMVLPAVEYDLYRIYELTENQAKLRVSRSTRDIAQVILARLEALPSGVTVDSISLAPSCLEWEAEVTISS